MSFIKLLPEDSVISSEVLVAPGWSGAITTLNSFFTSSAQETGSGKFFLNVYQTGSNVSGSEIQFSLAYGHVSGSGSAPFNSSIPAMTYTRDIFGQFRNLVYGDENTSFNFGGTNGISRDIFVLSVNRSRYKENINVGTLNLTLSGSGGILQLTDDSKDTTTTTYIGSNRVYNIVSGSNGNSYNSTTVQTNSGSYGLFLPDIGTILLNPRALALSSGNGGVGMTIDETVSTSYVSTINTNTRTLFNTIKVGNSFSMRSEETITARYFSIAVKFNQLNHTTNPSIIDNKGNILYPSLIDNPQSFPTTVGLYNDSGELMAVSKLSKPLTKDSTKLVNLRVKLEF